MDIYSTLVEFKETIFKTTENRGKKLAMQSSPSRGQMYHFSRHGKSVIAESSAVGTAISFKMIDGVFYVCLISLLCSLIVFFMELIFHLSIIIVLVKVLVNKI